MLVAFKYLEDEATPGECITPQKDHFDRLSADKKKAETAIRRGSPQGTLRAHAVYVFEDREVAEALLDEAADKHLYEVTVDESDVLHRADLRIYDEIVEALRNGNSVGALVSEFWQGKQRPSPRIELAVSKIRIRRKIADKARAGGA